MAPETDRYGYLRVKLSRDGRLTRFKVHTLVCTTFNGPAPDGTEVAHMDDNKTNNVPNNLRWVSHAENVRHHSQPIGERT